MDEVLPENVPIRFAATVMLIDDRPDLQVFMMQRNAKTVFAGGMWVFPGGAVDATDKPEFFESISIHRNDMQASKLLDLKHGGLSFYVAAIREAFEEAGILLALHKNDHRNLEIKNDKDKARYDLYRDEVNADAEAFIKLIEKEQLILDVGQMHYVARWITPEGPPRRFDARFFISRMPSFQTPIHDDNELVHSAWFSPQEILEKFDRGEMILMSPTLRMVRNLANFTSADEAIKAAAKNLPSERARINNKREIILPGDEGYENGEEDVEFGWVSLRTS
ncbi:MAG: 8-oxo-dGTP pyrophosphatase MutT (NUDIX family) [Candidatus Azotimanducaceae bacterium]|jgi:8-oxo-dGTP pyrophosphatase MutT (NUDIX family)